MIWEFVWIHPPRNCTISHTSQQGLLTLPGLSRSLRNAGLSNTSLDCHRQPTSCLHFELLTPAATSFICRSVRWCPHSVFSQRGIVDKPRRRVTGKVYGLWHCIKKQVQTKTRKIKVRDQPSVSVSPHSIYKIGLCALGVNVWAGAARHGSRLCVWRIPRQSPRSCS